MKLLEKFNGLWRKRENQSSALEFDSKGKDLSEKVQPQQEAEQAVINEAKTRLKVAFKSLDFKVGGGITQGAAVVGVVPFERSEFSVFLTKEVVPPELLSRIPEELFSVPLNVSIENDIDNMASPEVHLSFSSGDSEVKITVPLELYEDTLFSWYANFETRSAVSNEKRKFNLTKTDILPVVTLIEHLIQYRELSHTE